MKHQVDIPGQGEAQLVSHGGQHLFHRERAVVSGGQLGSWLTGAKVVPF